MTSRRWDGRAALHRHPVQPAARGLDGTIRNVPHCALIPRRPGPGKPQALVLVMLVIYALDVPLVIAFTVARYASPAGHAGSLPDVSRPA